MQLVAYGAQDIYLTGNPQITFFKVVYRRHTNFSMETISQTLNGTQDSVQNGNATCTISRNGDLVHKVYVTADSSTATNGSALVNEVELEIGGQRIDRHYQEWNEVWNELSTDESKAIALKAMQCEVGTGETDAVETIQIPLNFWFCRNPGLALPLIALQYHEVKIKFTWGDAGVGLNPEVWCDYIYLDTDERRRFAQVSHEYLIEQLQRDTYGSGTGDKKLNFNHPVKELIWVNTAPNAAAVKYQLKLNGHDRFAEQPKEYFMLRQPFDYHTAVPRQNLPSAAQLTSNYVDISETDSLEVASVTSVADGGGSASAIGPATGELSIVKYLNYDSSNPGQSTVQILSAGTPWAGEIAPRTAESVVYLFLNGTDITSPAVGDLVQITGSGSRFAGGSTAGSIFARVTESFLSDAGGGAADLAANIRVLQFDRVLFTGLGVIGDGEVVITGINVVTANAALVSQARTSQLVKDINVYSFALKPEEHQPSGTCNFSRIDNAQLKVSGADDGGGNIYAVNYNVLRIMSGMGGLAYSN